MHTEISPWIERLSPYRLAIAAGGAFLLLLVALGWVAWRWGVAEDRMALMQKQAEAGFLQAPSSTRTVRVDLRAPGAVSVGGRDFPERVDLRLNARTDRFARFRVSLLREDGTLLAARRAAGARLELRPAAFRSTRRCCRRAVRAPRRRLRARRQARALRRGPNAGLRTVGHATRETHPVIEQHTGDFRVHRVIVARLPCTDRPCRRAQDGHPSRPGRRRSPCGRRRPCRGRRRRGRVPAG